jgi:hypothetical protein
MRKNRLLIVDPNAAVRPAQAKVLSLLSARSAVDDGARDNLRANNPLWAITIGMAVFFGIVAALVALG